MGKPDCHQCKHYFITFDVAVPYGCRAFRFKSKDLPSKAVAENSGHECHAFEQKTKRPEASGHSPGTNSNDKNR